MRIEMALLRIEGGIGTLHDAEILRQEIAARTVQVEGMRQEMEEARRELQTLMSLAAELREAMKDHEAWNTVDKQRRVKDTARALDVYLLRAAGEKIGVFR
jgi:hypothetical protein